MDTELTSFEEELIEKLHRNKEKIGVMHVGPLNVAILFIVLLMGLYFGRDNIFVILSLLYLGAHSIAFFFAYAKSNQISGQIIYKLSAKLGIYRPEGR